MIFVKLCHNDEQFTYLHSFTRDRTLLKYYQLVYNTCEERPDAVNTPSVTYLQIGRQENSQNTYKIID